MTQHSEHQQVSHITRLAQEIRDEKVKDPEPPTSGMIVSNMAAATDKYYFSHHGGEDRHANGGGGKEEGAEMGQDNPGGTIWSIAKLTEHPAETSQDDGAEEEPMETSRPASLLVYNGVTTSTAVTPSVSIRERPDDTISPIHTTLHHTGRLLYLASP